MFFSSLRRYAIRGSNGFSAEFRRDAVRWRGFLWMINDSTRSVSLGFPLKAKMATKCSKVSPFPPFSQATSGFPSSNRLSVIASPRCTASWLFSTGWLPMQTHHSGPRRLPRSYLVRNLYSLLSSGLCGSRPLCPTFAYPLATTVSYSPIRLRPAWLSMPV